MPDETPAIEQLVGSNVVLDVASPYVFVGTLAAVESRYLVLVDADVHDLRDTKTSRELYVVDSNRHGVRANRARVLVNRNEVVSLSALDDVLD